MSIKIMRCFFCKCLPSAVMAFLILPMFVPAHAQKAADVNAAEVVENPMRPILGPNNLAKNGAKSLAIQYDDTDHLGTKFVLQGLDGERILWTKSIVDPDGTGPQNIYAEAVGTSKIKITKLVRYTPIFILCLWDGKNFKFISQSVDDSPKKSLRSLFDTITSGKLEDQNYYNSIGENYCGSLSWTDRNAIAKMIQGADATAMKEYHQGRLDKAIAREAASLTTAAELLQHILATTEHIQVEDSTIAQADSSQPLHWLAVFQKAHIKPNVWHDDRTSFPPSDYVGAANNYAYFLQLKGEHSKAIPIFERIIAIDPERSVTYLNLGDSLFATGAKKSAIDAYANYQKHLDKHTIIPERVIERTKDNPW